MELAVDTPDAWPWFSTSMVYSLSSKVLLSTLAHDLLPGQSLPQASNHARSYSESRVLLTSDPDFNTTKSTQPRPAFCHVCFTRDHFYLSTDTDLGKLDRYIQIYI